MRALSVIILALSLPAAVAAVTPITFDLAVDDDADNRWPGIDGFVMTGLQVTAGTEPFPGHGPYTAAFTNVNSGSYDPGSGGTTVACDFEANLGGNVDQSLGMSLGVYALTVCPT